MQFDRWWHAPAGCLIWVALFVLVRVTSELFSMLVPGVNEDAISWASIILGIGGPLVIYSKIAKRLDREKAAVFRAITAERARRGMATDIHDEFEFDAAWSSGWRARADLKARYLYREKPTHFDEADAERTSR